MLSDFELKKLADVFKQYSDIIAVYLFGSWASDKRHADSDMDLAVYTEVSGLYKKKLEILGRLAEAGFEKTDLVFLNQCEPLLAFEAVKHNQVIYSTPVFLRGLVYARIIGGYLDLEYYLDYQRSVFKERVLSGQA